MLNILQKLYSKIQFDPNYTTQSQANILIKHSNSFACVNDPITLMKSCKNKTEVNGARKAHLIDGIALTKFIYWLENEVDTDKNNWIKAIEKDNLTWSHVSDLQGWNNAAGKLYAVNAIPHSIILDKNGTIVAKNLRGEELRDKIAELLD